MKIAIRLMLDPWSGAAAAGLGIVGGLAGRLNEKHNDRRQIQQQQKLQSMSIEGQKQMADYMQGKQLEMWEKTGYGAQKEQMKAAGLNPALMYGMGGGGGQTASAAGGSVGAGSAAGNSGEAQGMLGMGLQAGAQLALLKAQKENIEADTENKKQDAGYTGGAKTENTKADTVLKGADVEKRGKETESLELDNRLKEYLQITDEKGRQVDGLQGSVAVQGALTDLRRNIAETIFKEDENGRLAVMNNAGVNKIAAEIDLMAKKGFTEMQILENLKKDGVLKDAEIAWNSIGLTKETLGQLVLGLLKGAAGAKGGGKK